MSNTYNDTADFGCLSVNEVASIFKCSRATIYNHLKAGHLKARKIGNLTRIDRAEARRFLTEAPDFAPRAA